MTRKQLSLPPLAKRAFRQALTVPRPPPEIKRKAKIAVNNDKNQKNVNDKPPSIRFGARSPRRPTQPFQRNDFQRPAARITPSPDARTPRLLFCAIPVFCPIFASAPSTRRGLSSLIPPSEFGRPVCAPQRPNAGTPERRNAGTPERRNVETPKRRNTGTLERWNVGTLERQNWAKRASFNGGYRVFWPRLVVGVALLPKDSAFWRRANAPVAATRFRATLRVPTTRFRRRRFFSSTPCPFCLNRLFCRPLGPPIGRKAILGADFPRQTRFRSASNVRFSLTTTLFLRLTPASRSNSARSAPPTRRGSSSLIPSSESSRTSEGGFASLKKFF